MEHALTATVDMKRRHSKCLVTRCSIDGFVDNVSTNCRDSDDDEREDERRSVRGATASVRARRRPKDRAVTNDLGSISFCNQAAIDVEGRLNLAINGRRTLNRQ